MKESRKQSIRLIKFVLEMKRNRYPNSESFAELLRRADIDENIDIACTPRTVQRDIDFLKNTYNAPLKFDAARNGYYLTDPRWTPEFQLPMEQREFVIHTLLGARMLEELAPQPLKREMEETRERVHAANGSSFLDNDFIEALIAATGSKVVIQPTVFNALIDAWRTRHTLKLTYCDMKGQFSEREIEPQVVAFHHDLWYVKGYKLPSHEVRTLAIHRIQNATVTEHTFAFDRALLDDTRKNGLFTYPKIEGVKLRCDATIAFYLKEHQVAKRFKIEPAPHGDLFVTLGPAIEHEVIRWILGEAGRIEVLTPLSLRKKIAEAGRHITQANTGE